MAVPTQAQFHRPVLEILAEAGSPLTIRRIMDTAAARMNLAEADKQQTEANGARKWEKRVRWAVHYLKDFGGLVQSPQYRQYEATPEGRQFLADNEGDITIRQLKELKATAAEPIPTDAAATPEYQENIFEHGRADLTAPAAIDATSEGNILDDPDVTPDDLIQAGYQQVLERLAEEMLESVKGVSPDRFEQLVVELLVEMGYGQGQAVGRTGDGGIDGIINQDTLGLERVYIQAKRYTSGSVGEPEIRNFSGSLDPYGATKGVFITTSTFSGTARQTARAISAGNKLIRLVDGNELAQLMIRHGVGVVTEYTYEIKKLDENYFAEEI